MKILSGKKYLVYGAGVSGKAAAKAIKRRGGKPIVRADVDGAFRTPPDRDYYRAVISPGIKPTHHVYEYCRERGIETTSEIALGFEFCPSDVDTIAVTGTNGKTTTVKLISAMTGGTACGNVGYPFTAAVNALEKARKKHKCVEPESSEPRKDTLVAEVSSFQLYHGGIKPRIAVITNTDIDHIDWHGSVEAYYACKCRIAENANCEYIVLGAGVTVAALAALKHSARVVYTSTTQKVDGAYIADGYFMFCGEKVCAVDYYRLRGAHNLENALCAIAAAKCAGVPNRTILSALATVEPEPHRLADVGAFAGKRWIDDSKGTNVSACLAAVRATDGELCLIVGGRDKALDFDKLFAALDARVTDVIAMGESAQSIRDAAARHGRRVRVVDSLAAAVAVAASTDAPTVLLSPACASFDEFSNYGERGDAFAAAVRALEK